MDLSLTPTQQMLKSTARTFVENECPSSLIAEIGASESGFSQDLWRQTSDLGWTSMLVPEEYDGLGSSFTDVGVLLMELGRGVVPGPYLATTVIAPSLLTAAGTEQQKRRWLPRIAAGGVRCAFAFAEADYGWSPESVQLRAAERNGGYVLDGTKWYVPDVQVADLIFVVARTRAAQSAGDGLTVFLVEPSQGVGVRDLSGWFGDKVNQVTFEGVSVSRDDVLGDVHGAWSFLEPVLDRATVGLCAYMTGGAERTYEISLAYAQDRVQFGQPIFRFTRVQDHLINILTGLDGARWTTYEAFAKIDAGEPVGIPASVAKIATADAYHRATALGQEVHGAIGTSRELPLYLYNKSSRWLFLYLGDPAFHRKRLAQLLEF